AAYLAHLYCDHGRWDEAVECLAYGEELDASEPPQGKGYAPLRLAAKARVAAHGGRLDEALELGGRGGGLVGYRDWDTDHARISLALAEVHRANGNAGEEEIAVAEARDLFEAKGNIAAVARLNAAAVR